MSEVLRTQIEKIVLARRVQFHGALKMMDSLEIAAGAFLERRQEVVKLSGGLASQGFRRAIHGRLAVARPVVRNGEIEGRGVTRRREAQRLFEMRNCLGVRAA